uniref:Uncharacterized protein n=1 Tax=Rhizophora mucronata TaxID=61149 RepID=A0A2P2N773_RHIMU
MYNSTMLETLGTTNNSPIT